MSSNPLMMGYEGGDLLLTGVAGQWSGRCPSLCVQAVGSGLVGQQLWFSDLSTLEAEDRRTTGLNRRSLPLPLPLCQYV